MKQGRSKNKIFIQIAVVFMLVCFPWHAIAAAYANIQAFGVDTIAGYSSLLSTSKTYPNQDIVFHIRKPDGALIDFKSKTDSNGVAKSDLYDFHTRKAGKYHVSVSMDSFEIKSAESDFDVFPDVISPEQSSIVAQSALARTDGMNNVNINVVLSDKYGNPIRGHIVNIVSSRADDNILLSSANSLTNQEGNVSFIASSNKPGLSVYSAIDSTAGVILTSRAQVAYMDGSNIISDAGGDFNDFIKRAAAATAGPLNNFEIVELPEKINPNQNVSFRVTAKDQDGISVENYTGTIHFSAEGANSSNVSLPEDYTFKAEDLGTHLFSLGLKFTVAGDYKIVATDVSNKLIKGEKSLTVGPSGSTTGGTTNQSQNPQISSPLAGIYAQNIQTIKGTAVGGSNIKIYDNAKEIGITQSSSAGSFSFQTGPLADGSHEVYAVAMDSSNNTLGTSTKTVIQIDTTPPKVDEVQLIPPTDVLPDSTVTIKVISEDKLSQASVIFNGDIVQLSEGFGTTSGSYIGTLRAPSVSGLYPIDIILTDQLNNEEIYKSQASITIGTPSPSTTPPLTTQQTQETQQVLQPPLTTVNIPPSQVFNVVAYGSNNKVTLVWDAAADDGMIRNYRIYYGTDLANLSKRIDTKGPSTTWYIPDMENGKEYFFAITAVDNTGMESLNRSEISNTIPFSTETITKLPNRPSGPISDLNALKGAALEGVIPPEMTKNGPELMWLLLGTGLFSGIARKFSSSNRKSH